MQRCLNCLGLVTLSGPRGYQACPVSSYVRGLHLPLSLCPRRPRPARSSQRRRWSNSALWNAAVREPPLFPALWPTIASPYTSRSVLREHAACRAQEDGAARPHPRRITPGPQNAATRQAIYTRPTSQGAPAVRGLQPLRAVCTRRASPTRPSVALSPSQHGRRPPPRSNTPPPPLCDRAGAGTARSPCARVTTCIMGGVPLSSTRSRNPRRPPFRDASAGCARDGIPAVRFGAALHARVARAASADEPSVGFEVAVWTRLGQGTSTSRGGAEAGWDCARLRVGMQMRRARMRQTLRVRWARARVRACASAAALLRDDAKARTPPLRWVAPAFLRGRGHHG
ncbi:hypothetical protein PHLGIDRAFT_472250 [Phlebiopsis gigantea 11061_1 CR5-6]|uniref:Uncharacterized protein n=1 Tax=Phlebiopsis gigantea (strain 11061_1 CR5-6) TaxID=745531 RepID=A0A0C3S6B9_PHLG1|nr:hypothetical protein PHLGIDRAFT_472250 [Phlebiopsis gigantea 11061_1 CR5-6]